MDPTESVVTLPPGVTVSPGRETTKLGQNGTTVQGMDYTLTLPNRAVTTVFVPYSDMGDIQMVHQMFQDRVDQINAVTSLGG